MLPPVGFADGFGRGAQMSQGKRVCVAWMERSKRRVGKGIGRANARAMTCPPFDPVRAPNGGHATARIRVRSLCPPYGSASFANLGRVDAAKAVPHRGRGAGGQHREDAVVLIIA